MVGCVLHFDGVRSANFSGSVGFLRSDDTKTVFRASMGSWSEIGKLMLRFAKTSVGHYERIRGGHSGDGTSAASAVSLGSNEISCIGQDRMYLTAQC